MSRIRHEISPTVWPSRQQATDSRLFSACNLGPICARTRSWVPAMVPWRATPDGFVSPEVLEWYGRFAEGQPGVLVVEATGIRDVPSGPLLRIGHDRFVPGLRQLVETVRERSEGQTRLLIQCIDFLGVKRRPEKSKFLRRFLALTEHHRTGLAAMDGLQSIDTRDDDTVRSALESLPHDRLLEVLSPREVDDLERGHRERVDDMQTAHIADLPRVLPGLFAAAAVRASDAGFDGVELHFAHAYTMASFLSRTNQRSDGYGQIRENRLRLPLDVYRAVRQAVGQGTCVGCRFLGDEVIEGGSRIDDAIYYGVEFARAGMDFLSISKGGKFEDALQPKVGHAVYPYTGASGQECMPTVRIDERGPFGRNLPLSHAIRAAVRDAGHDTPIVGAGGINSFELAEQALSNGDCDMVGAARQSLADPDWWLKMETGRGQETMRCLYTNYCEALDQRHAQVTCQLWDRKFDQPDRHGQTLDAISRSGDGKRRLVPPSSRE